ncbi:hypothetical protein [Ruminococcus sp. HUN007]|uniref:hypothetical protein n=1 Tax=Ruminococcus sp. HUN007 TaxID=1514668 RepID=UPI0005D14C0B|nr:hypothetical protein [Ruminococcus sp. HUN007]
MIFFNVTERYSDRPSVEYVSGWPSDKGGTRLISPVLSFGITSSSEHKENAWEFIKYVINNMNTNYSYGQYTYSSSNDAISISCISSDSSVMKSQIDEEIKKLL